MIRDIKRAEMRFPNAFPHVASKRDAMRTGMVANAVVWPGTADGDSPGG